MCAQTARVEAIDRPKTMTTGPKCGPMCVESGSERGNCTHSGNKHLSINGLHRSAPPRGRRARFSPKVWHGHLNSARIIEYREAVRLAFFLATGLFCSAAHAYPSTAYSLGTNQDVLVDGPDGVESIPIGCTGIALLEHNAKLYVACGAEGIAVLSLADPLQPTVEFRSRGQKDEEALEFFVRDGRVWVRMRAQTERLLAPALQTGAKSKQLGSTGESCRDDYDCRGHLRCVNAECYAPASRTDRVAHEGTEEPRPKPEPYAPWVAPPRRGRILSLAVGVAGWLPTSPLGVSVFVDLEAIYRFGFPLTIRAKLAPIGFAFAAFGNVFATSFAGLASVDLDYFEIGLGPGAMSLNTFEGPKTTFLLAPFLRIGSIDGLGIWLQGDISVIDHMPQAEWQGAGLSGEIQIPVSDRWALRFRGGGSIAGWGRADGGVRWRVTGDGGRHTVYVSGWACLGGMFFTPSAITYLGPGLGAGLEWRP
jgi:hypothetical protein